MTTENFGPAQMRENARREFASGEITGGQQALVLAMADFCERHNVFPAETGLVMGIWGLGEADVIFESADGDHRRWIPASRLAEPLGVTYDELLALYVEELAENGSRADELKWVDDDGRECCMDLVNESFVLMALVSISPWSSAFMDSSMDLMRHAALNSGIADLVTTIDGRTYREVIAGEDLPSLEVARHQARSGLPGALERLGGES